MLKTSHLIRLLDILISFLGLLILFPVLLLIFLLGAIDSGAPIFVQSRLGRDERPFRLIKFRTLPIGTRNVSTHLITMSTATAWGKFLRRTKLDELPQLWNVLRGDMSLVGPRPCLPNQYSVIQERRARSVFTARPGITGPAQTRGIDMSSPEKLAKYDAMFTATPNVRDYFVYIIHTLLFR